MLITLLFSLSVQAQELTLITPDKKQTVTLSDLKSKLKITTVTIDDPVYHSKKTYEGFRLDQVMGLLGDTTQGADEWVFTATDGYAPSISIAKAKKYHPILTFAEKGKSGFEKVAQGKTMIDPGPFYVVWREGKKVGEEFPWPYQLASIEVVSFAKKFPKLYPKNTSANSLAMKGFSTFKSLCIRCHSVNLEGGDLAPELNIPKNITEYWSEPTLKAFIKDAGQFRMKSKMPSFAESLSDQKITEIIAYLKAMKSNKIQPDRQ